MVEGFRHEAGGGGEDLTVIRYGRDEMTQREATNNEGSTILPGEALMLTEDGNGNAAFVYHDGSADEPVYVAIEARGRGMNADTDDGYADGEAVPAVQASGGGLNVKLGTGEAVGIGDSIGVDAAAADGTFTSSSGDYNDVFASADEQQDLTGASSPELTATEVAN